MADARMPDEFFDELKPFLPAEKKVGRKGGRPRVPHRTVMNVIWFILVSGCRWEDVPPEMGCSGRTAHRRLIKWQRSGIWSMLHEHFLASLRKAGVLEPQLAVIDGVLVRAFGGGDDTGPSPVDRRKLGSKHTLVVDANGVPLVIRTAPANASDHTQILPAVAEFPEISGAPGRPRTKPDVVYGDRGYDSQATRAALREQHITPRIAQRGKEHGSGLGKIRWVVERTIHWFKGFRRIRIRYDRTRVVQNAWNALAASAICFRIAVRTGVCPA
jgi:transposase